ncbi:alkaline phosphatase [Dulcicalothrix desertica PCC 7102]|uniref:Alkaline phosphatase n=1 Tax=Dulcicalothrix desertica PCC 7102 TaxID=232991 RepID=A0A433VQ29_9CYAN|nr:alkaline phosphatase [Dulcicalothrix desertica PCC 7102]
MFDWIIPSVINIVYSLGYFGIALMMFLENLFPPIPSELIMPLAGFTAKEVAVAAAQASLKKLADKYGKWITVSSKDITKSIEWFDRAGIGNMLLPSFLFYTTLGSALWTCLLTYSGYASLYTVRVS